MIGYAFTYSYIGVVFLISYMAKKVFNINKEGTRKIIHILVCFAWIIMEKCFGADIGKVIIPFTFVIINWIAMKYDLLGIMNRDEKSYGTVLYALSLTIMNGIALLNPRFAFPVGVGLFVLSFGDGFAAVLGKRYGKKRIFNKSIIGSMSCFLFSIIGIIIVCCFIGEYLRVREVLFLAFSATILEVLGGKLDNVVIPFGIMILTYFIV